ncbi:AAA family ATPase [Sphingopyxis indica]|uniref:ATP-dependent nuclease n=1 Tax=Sphingopyxis indica TaxID=436663 RepID=UPI0029391498|nr:AAA family ATPase [Sphingopyxis indica]WOF43220.1 AAA family ATPase [Sphingopyxis indica]
MQIIDQIEINYFRSVYSVSLKKCKDINVITGTNDSGKSNILKALNLFFNGVTEPHTDFDFIKDLNRDREEEARAAKGRMTIWMRVYFKNFLNWQSLPDRFSIKRSWNRYDLVPTDSYDDDIPNTTIGRFLNKLQFHYIPAIRSRDIFSDLLADMHDTLLQDESLGLKNSSEALVNDLHNLTEEMSVEILDILKIESTINIPENLKDLFRALDFTNKFGDHDIPLVLRGDGIQSRHMPFILDYISSKSKKYHIWGYEEPENSLELTKSFEMADDFRRKFSVDNQIFLTTHSPAFYDISGENAARWYIENREDDDRTASCVESISSTSDIDGTMGLLALITPRMRQVYDELSGLKESIHDMQGRLDDVECPVAYVEGPTDVTILERAKAALGFGDMNIRFEPSHGVSNLLAFLKVNERIKSDERPLIGIFDADAAGRKELQKFSSSHFLPETNFRVVSKPKRIFAGDFKTPGHLEEAEAAFRAIGMALPLPIEFMFPRAVLDAARAEEVLVLEPRMARIANEELPLEVNVDDAIHGRIAEDFRYLAKQIQKDSKVPFADWVVQREDEVFEVFRSLFEDLAVAISAFE